MIRNSPDPTLRYADMTQPGFAPPVPVNASYNGELYKALSPRMMAVLKAKFPPGITWPTIVARSAPGGARSPCAVAAPDAAPRPPSGGTSFMPLAFAYIEVNV